ncbi:hypothetical protein FG386_000771 [Cryptosporidium ryanae]|uniref:uncharacterized protein n=1 Tax=Cryptosporidium ryanae TaxID=515981 RepID=UPI003519F8A2|nr:hypothetical protein FG386_000771 [Cryptosporidium ryanae]
MNNLLSNKKRSILNNLIDRKSLYNEEITEKKLKLSIEDKHENCCKQRYPLERELTNIGGKTFPQLENLNITSQFSDNNILFKNCLQRDETYQQLQNQVMYFEIQKNGKHYAGYSNQSKNTKNFCINENNFNFTQKNSIQIYKHLSNNKLPIYMEFYQKKLIPYLYQAEVMRLQNEMVMLISNYIFEEKNEFSTGNLCRNFVTPKAYPRFHIYDQIQSNQLNSMFPIIEQTKKQILSYNMNLNKFMMIPSCTRCLLPGFHSNTAWLLPPSFFGRGGRLKRKTGFLKGLPIGLFGVCFSIKNILTVESTNLLVTSARREEYEYIKKGIITLKEEGFEESIYYVEDNIITEKIGSTTNDVAIQDESTFENKYDSKFGHISAQNATFCGFVTIDSISDESSSNMFLSNKNIIDNSESHNIKSDNQSNLIAITYIDDKKFPNKISDCDILKNKINSNSFQDPNVENHEEQKVLLLIPRLKCMIKQSKFNDLIFTLNKPCYLLLWNYNVRNCNNTTKDINWINIQCRFFPLKYFGNAFKKSVSINIKPHQELILDQLNRIRNIEEARIFAWILAGCMQFTINELLLDSFTRSLFFDKNILDIQNIPTFSESISKGPFLDFPESPLDQNGEIRWEILKEILETDLHI